MSKVHSISGICDTLQQVASHARRHSFGSERLSDEPKEWLRGRLFNRRITVKLALHVKQNTCNLFNKQILRSRYNAEVLNDEMMLNKTKKNADTL